jgi:hypothetical protein
MPPSSVEPFKRIFGTHDDYVYQIGEVVSGEGAVKCDGRLQLS